MAVDNEEARRAARAVARTHISELDMQIESLQRSIALLTLERNKCYEELNMHQYPVLTLPTEITVEIFTQFVPAYLERPPLLGPLSPSFLCCICRMWRNVALSTPTLWSAIQLHLETPRRYEQQLHLLELWLQRSGGCPLSIELVQNRDNATSPTSFIEVIRSSHRWQNVRLVLPSNQYHQFTGPMPLLRSLILGPTEPIGHVDPGVESAAKFARAPALKNLVLSLYYTPLSIGLPWSQLTTLAAQIMFDSFFAEILRSTVSLEECHIKLLFIDLSEPITPIPPLLRLRFFSFLSAGGQVPDRLNHILAALTLPALQRIAVFEPFLGTDPVAALTELCPSGNPQRIKITGARRTFAAHSTYIPQLFRVRIYRWKWHAPDCEL